MRDGWVETTLGEISEVVGGGTPSTSQPEYWDGQIVWLTPTEVTSQDGKEIDNSIRKISELGFKNSGAQILPKGSVILTSRASVGFVAIAGTDLCTNQGFQSLIPKESVVAKFLMFWIQQNRSEFDSRSAGSTFKEISKSNVKSIRILLPPLAEQKRIVDLISSVDSYIEALQQQVDKARKSRNAVLHELLTKGGDSWVDFKFKDVAKAFKGKLPKEKNELGIGLPYLTANYLRSNAPDFWIENLEGAVIAEQGECLILWDGAGAGDLFKAQNGVVSSTMAVVKSVNANILRDFLTLFISSKADYIKETCRGTTVPHVSPDAIENMNLIIPHLAEQKRIVDLFTSFDTQIDALEQSLNKSKNLRSALLSDLLSGSHEIPTTYDKLIGAA